MRARESRTHARARPHVHIVGVRHLFTTEPPAAAAQQQLENEQDELQERAQAEREAKLGLDRPRVPGALLPG